MLTIKNALAYVWRKKIKTLIIFLILLAISTLTLGSIAVKNATDAASKETFKNITSSFSMEQEILKAKISKLQKKLKVSLATSNE